MAKLTRVYQRLFGSTASANQIAKFGSLAAGSPVRYDGATASAATIQSLSNWLDGWFGAVIGANSPAIEDVNAAFFVAFYQLGYLLQSGVPEWDATTIYFIGSVAQDGFGNLYTSLADNNTGNALTDATKWAPPGGANKSKSANYTLLATDALVAADASAGAFSLTLPLAAGNPGRIYYIKKIDSSDNAVTLVRTGADLIDGETSQLLQGSMAGVTLRSDGVSNWYVF